MCRIRPLLAAVALAAGLAAEPAVAQTGGVMNFDAGGDGSSWNQANNWEHALDPDGAPTSGNPPTPPTGQYTANIGQLGVVLDNTMPGQTAFRTRVGVGTAGGFTVSGGSLEVTDDISVGHTAQGTMLMTGGAVTLGDDFFIDSNGDFDSTFTMEGGTLHIIDRLTMGNNGHMQMNGGEVSGDDDFYILGTATVTMTGGLMQTIDKINMGNATPAGPARLKINGGIMRGNEWTDNPDLTASDPTRFMSIIEINGSGKLQIEQVNFPIAEVLGLISGGRIVTTGGSPLGVSTVIVPDFFGQANVTFTQVSVIPEPSALLLASIGIAAAGLCRRRRS